MENDLQYVHEILQVVNMELRMTNQIGSATNKEDITVLVSENTEDHC